MMIAVAFFAALALLCCALAENINTSLLLPDALFIATGPFQRPTFIGQVTVTQSTTCYILDCNAGGAATYFDPGDACGDNSYTFSEMSASTQYVLNSFEDVVGTGAASTSIDDIQENSTIDCNPLASGSATCTTTYTDDEDNTSMTANVESSLYSVIFTVAAGYTAASSTVSTTATPSPTPSAPTAKPTSTSTSTSTASTNPTLSPSAKLGIGLGVPLGACAFAALALLLYRHGKHKERSRMSQMGNLAPPGGFVVGSEGKRVAEAGQTMGRQPPVYSMEMQG